MFEFKVDLGQLIICTLIAIVGYFVKRTIDGFGKRLDKHEDVLFKLVGDVQRVIGIVSGMKNRIITGGIDE